MTMAFTNGVEQPTVQKAIVVDDNIINAHYLKKMLTDEGLEITVISDTSQLFKLSNEVAVKMVFLNEETLGGQMNETIDRLSQISEDTNHSITIVGTTPYSLEGARKKLLSMGAAYALSTPIYKNHLEEIIRTSTKEKNPS
ncbi:response regulator [Flammeovirga kamogawensis]|uniref:Response regulator n=1 Tax=Flammeovirga kamogawensis TaxID=373891 RepID=A0ABX8GSE3_9BACT|nr:response regulator [Flammeovirga kamogawensis]MBB6462979.1 CheY-like chemotaxis protein [Flammeovirga kamogawensis]QWG06504.1 response regulator [Flammeovirga kamogawensis]TRX68332.1 response regulator [Flammeovirga kamogawensis]